MFVIGESLKLIIELFLIGPDLEDVPLHKLHDDLVLHGDMPDEVELDTRLEITALRTDSATITTDSFDQILVLRH